MLQTYKNKKNPTLRKLKEKFEAGVQENILKTPEVLDVFEEEEKRQKIQGTNDVREEFLQTVASYMQNSEWEMFGTQQLKLQKHEIQRKSEKEPDAKVMERVLERWVNINAIAKTNSAEDLWRALSREVPGIPTVNIDNKVKEILTNADRKSDSSGDEDSGTEAGWK